MNVSWSDSPLSSSRSRTVAQRRPRARRRSPRPSGTSCSEARKRRAAAGGKVRFIDVPARSRRVHSNWFLCTGAACSKDVPRTLSLEWRLRDVDWLLIGPPPPHPTPTCSQRQCLLPVWFRLAAATLPVIPEPHRGRRQSPVGPLARPLTELIQRHLLIRYFTNSTFNLTSIFIFFCSLFLVRSSDGGHVRQEAELRRSCRQG